MELSTSDAWERVIESRHGVLGTMHPERGVDLVPVVYAVADNHTIFLPIDTVKAKTSTRLQRLDNIRSDPRATLLVDAYDDDWTRLWWVRLNGEGTEATADDSGRFASLLADRYPEYTDAASIVGGIVLRPLAVTGWAAGA
jgi:PPOX class probable F420-dependent enzyme